MNKGDNVLKMMLNNFLLNYPFMINLPFEIQVTETIEGKLFILSKSFENDIKQKEWDDIPQNKIMLTIMHKYSL